jgi:DNA-binding NtrC family response regulator
MEHLLIVDDNKGMRDGLVKILRHEFKKLRFHVAENGKSALEIIKQEPIGIVLLDLQMPEMDGFEFLKQLQELNSPVTVVMMTAYSSIETAVNAIKLGAYDFISKPFDKDSICRMVAKCIERNNLIHENIDLKKRVSEEALHADFIGQSFEMKSFLKKLQTIAYSDYTVLIRGESGTGKELAARAIHRLSKRNEKKYVVVNCPTIPELLLESELFGHKRGAFTGATNDQSGLFVEAEGGTVCLDEIGDISLPVQAKLLRVIQEQEIKPLGAMKTKKVNIRIIASTNVDLEKKIAAGKFREDLFYRLNVVSLETLPLNKMRDDIPLLAKHFVKKVCQELDFKEKQFSSEALMAMTLRSWPGNVRQLQNVVRKATMFCPSTVIDSDCLKTHCDFSDPNDFPNDFFIGNFLVDESEIGLENYKTLKNHFVGNFTIKYITKLLDITNGNVSKAAGLSGVSRVALQNLIQRYNIRS